MLYHGPNGTTEIKCDTAILNKVYQNVRKQLYCEVDQAKLGLDSVVEWNIDGVSVLAKDLELVMTRFKEQGLLFKVVECRKIDEYTYSYGPDKIKNFKQPAKSHPPIQ